MRKKGQAAMEFLMTYGWAILAAVIVVGVLWYLLGNPANLAGNQFQVSAPLAPKGMVIEEAGVTINVLNGYSSAINISNVTLTDETGCTNSTGSDAIAVGDEYAIFIPCVRAQGYRYTTDVSIEFVEFGKTFQQQATGSVSGVVP